MHKKKLFSLFLTIVLITAFSLGVTAEEDYSDTEIWGDSAQTENSQHENPQTLEDASEKTARQSFAPSYSGVDRVNIYNSKNTGMLFSVLKTLGIMDSYENPDAILTRSEFAGIIARIMQNGKSESAPAWRYEFKDVDDTVKNQSDIIYLANYGIVQGDGQGNFYPDNNIKNTEAVIMLLNMMGYYEVAQLYGGGLSGYMKLSNKLEFSKEISMAKDKELTAEDAVRLIYHALHERVADSSSFTSNSVTFKTSDETLMYRYMDIMTVEGVVTANEYTSLYSSEGAASEKCIQIGDTEVSFAGSGIFAPDYLGLYSRIYFKENSGDYTAVFAECIENRQDVLKINAADIEGYNSENKTLSYTEKERTKTIDIPIDASIIFNGVVLGGSIDAHCFTPDTGQLVFIDNDRDGKYDCIMIDSYVMYLVKNTLINDEDILYDDLSVQPMISLSDKEIRVMKNNAEASAADVQSGNVAMVASNKVMYKTIGDLTYTEIDASSEIYSILVADYQVKGTLDSLMEDNFLTIDGVKYKYSNGFLISAKKGDSSKTTDSKVMNVTVIAGLDLDGNIAWIERSSDSSLKYGYLVKLGEGKNFLSPNQIMLYTQDNEMNVFEFADKVKVYSHWDGGDINTQSYYSKRIEGNAVTELDMLYKEGKGVQQLLRYKLDSDGKVSSIYIAAKDLRSYTTDVPLLYDNIFYNSISLKDTYFFNYPDVGGVISPLFEYNKTKTFGFAVPDNPDVTEAKYFTVHKNEITLFGNGSKIENIDLYNVDNGLIGAFVYKQTVNVKEGDASVAFDANGTFSNIIVESARQVRNSDDEYVTEIMAYDQNKLQSFNFTSGELISLPNANDSDLNEIKVSDLKRGDIILIHQNTLGEIDGFKVLHRISKAIKDAGNLYIQAYEQTWDGSLYSSVQPVYPKLFARGEVVKSINGIPYVDTGRSDNLLRRLLIYGWTNQVIIYDVQNDEMILTQDNNKRGDFSQLQEGDYLFWYQSERAILSAVAIRNYK